MISVRKPLFLLSLVALAPVAFADDFSFAIWTPTSSTTATTAFQTDKGVVTATLTGSYTGGYGGPGDYDVYQPASSFTGGIVGNAPIAPTVPGTYYGLRIDHAASYTLSFSQPVTNLAYDLWSLGAPGTPVSYQFTQPFSLVAGGPSQEYAGGPLTQTGNTVSGQEGNGTILFTGTYSTISWNVIGDEGFQVFTVGLQRAQTTPEPSALAALGIGAIALVRRRSRKA